MAVNMITIKQYIIEKNNMEMAMNMITIKQYIVEKKAWN